ncbi:MAG TPA: DUF937 domain-containing protein [Methylobacterium sp.]|jgi:hypothetical protein
MFNLFDILQAQGGTGVQGIGQQFGLSPDQSRKAMEALLPAFTLGLQRNAANDPTGFAQLFGMVSPGAPPQGFASASPQMDMLVRQLFGSPHLSQAVIQQAANVSGVATPVMRQMLPALAGMVVAGIVHVMINQNPPPPQRPASPAPTPYGFPAASYWTDMVDAFLTAGGGAKPAETPPRSRAATLAAQARTDAPVGAPFEAFQQMFQSGIEAQQENVRAMQQLFDAFWRDRTVSTENARTDDGRKESGRRKP